MPFEPGANYDDIVVGTGLSGVATVLLLARCGRRVSVIEARRIAAVTTGNTTAKLSRMQGTPAIEDPGHGAAEDHAGVLAANRKNPARKYRKPQAARSSLGSP